MMHTNTITFKRHDQCSLVVSYRQLWREALRLARNYFWRSDRTLPFQNGRKEAIRTEIPLKENQSKPAPHFWGRLVRCFDSPSLDVLPLDRGGQESIESHVTGIVEAERKPRLDHIEVLC